MVLSFLLWVESLFDTKILFVSTQPWYLLTKNLNNSWWNYFYSFFVSNFFGVVFYQDLIYMLNALYEVRTTRYCRFDLISSALIVGYNNIHPPLFYIFLWATLALGFEDRFITTKYLFCLGAIIFYWGSLWGVGNAAWGYFWVKDIIELALLIALILLIIFFHSPIRVQHFFKLCLCWFIIGSTLLLLRWGFIFTRHSFFNLLGTVNFCKFYLILFSRVSWGFFSVILVYTPLVSFTFSLYILCFFVLTAVRSATEFRKYLFFHSLLLVYTISWLKYQPHNFTIFETFLKLNSHLYGVTSKALLDGLNLISISQHAFKRFAVYSYYYLYNSKIVISELTVYINWSRFFVISIFLISIRRFTYR